jgi:hypothetical protein
VDARRGWNGSCLTFELVALGCPRARDTATLPLMWRHQSAAFFFIVSLAACSPEPPAPQYATCETVIHCMLSCFGVCVDYCEDESDPKAFSIGSALWFCRLNAGNACLGDDTPSPGDCADAACEREMLACTVNSEGL